MSELTDRDELEEQLAKKFGEVGRRHGLEFAQLLGDPPKLENVPQEFWDKIEEEMQLESYAILLLIFGRAADHYGWQGAEANFAASGYAKQEAKRFGAYWADSSRTLFQNELDRYYRGTVNGTSAHPSVRQHQDAHRQTGVTNRILRPGNADYDRMINRVFGPQRAAYHATNETTRSRSFGSEAAVDATFGLDEQDIWVNPRDGATCEFCLPLVYTTRSVWIRQAPDGPPPPMSMCHCRCYISYLADRVRDGIAGDFPRWTEEERRRYFINPESMRRVQPAVFAG